MLFSVRHETRYQYSAPVSFVAHVLRLTPRPESGTLLSHELSIDPVPIGREDVEDAFGNPVTHVRFEGEWDHLRVESRFELETVSKQTGAQSGLPDLPWRVEQASDYLPPDPIDPEVRAFASELAAECGGDVSAFLDRLNDVLFTRIDRHIRMDGNAHSPAHTLATRTGACRDLAVLFMAACRSLGLPSRFVSGYQARTDNADGRRHMHAWPEVFLPGIGWQGFDPTHGTRVAGGHVGLCAAPDQAGTMPVEGGFFGGNVTSTLSYDLRISTDE